MNIEENTDLINRLKELNNIGISSAVKNIPARQMTDKKSAGKMIANMAMGLAFEEYRHVKEIIAMLIVKKTEANDIYGLPPKNFKQD
ncbi:MAG: hypothetical protein ACXVCP_00260 [Bdellovibrio sp.]